MSEFVQMVLLFLGVVFVIFVLYAVEEAVSELVWRHKKRKEKEYYYRPWEGNHEEIAGLVCCLSMNGPRLSYQENYIKRIIKRMSIVDKFTTHDAISLTIMHAHECHGYRGENGIQNHHQDCTYRCEHQKDCPLCGDHPVLRY